MTDHERTGDPPAQEPGDLLGYPDRDAGDEAMEFPAQERPGQEIVGGDPSMGGTAANPGPDAGAGDDPRRENG